MVTKNYKLKPGQNLLFTIVTNGLYRYVGEDARGSGETGWLNARITKGSKTEYIIHMDTCGDTFLFTCDEHGKVWVENRVDGVGFITLIEDATSSSEKSNLG